LLDHWECYRSFRRQSKRGGRLPTFLGAKFGDMCGVMIAVPGVEEEHPVEGADAVIGMAESAGEFVGSDGTQEANPTLVKRVEQIEGELGRSVLGVFEFGPGGFVVWLDGGLDLGESKSPADVGVHVAVGDVMGHLANGPAAFAIRGVDLRVAEARDGGTQPGGSSGNFGDGGFAHRGGDIFWCVIFTDGIAWVH
jgi:hypothetical protein